MRRSTFEAWGFDNVWAIREGFTYPYLQQQPAPYNENNRQHIRQLLHQHDETPVSSHSLGASPLRSPILPCNIINCLQELGGGFAFADKPIRPCLMHLSGDILAFQH